MAKQADLRIEGLGAVLKDLRKLPKEASAELRHASVDIATRHMLPSWKNAALTAGEWGPKLAASIRVRSDRLPALLIGKDRRSYSGGASTNMVRYPAFLGARNKWPPFGDGTGWMNNRTPYARQAFREWEQAAEVVTAKWNRNTL